jgi:hypothetical protein
MKYHLREYLYYFFNPSLGKNKKLKDVITSSMSTIVDTTCCFFYVLHLQLATLAHPGGGGWGCCRAAAPQSEIKKKNRFM